MTKTHKAVLSTLAVLCLLFMGSGVAQAQECIARAISAGTVRAEGITEQVTDIELRCGRPTATGSISFGIPDFIDIAVELNTNITNEITDATRVVTIEDIMGDPALRIAAKIPYSGTNSEGIGLVAHQLTARDVVGDAAIEPVMFVGGTPAVGAKLSKDGTTIEWTKIPKANLNLGENANAMDDLGFRLLIKGIRVNASSVGDGEDVMATVMVNSAALGSPFKVADVSTGLLIKTLLSG